uniref:G-protein coupled receptors family 1 profile domain-containing protein n=1 Tax=Romanomermis culicivorax TaxID=13658 RepID=A0A915IPG5_ROMCU
MIYKIPGNFVQFNITTAFRTILEHSGILESFIVVEIFVKNMNKRMQEERKPQERGNVNKNGDIKNISITNMLTADLFYLYNNTTNFLHVNGVLSLNNYNSASESSYSLVTFIFSIAMALLCFLGIAGNIVSIVIFTRPMMTSPINVLLTGISFIDIVVTLLAIPVFVVTNLDEFLRLGYVENYYSVVILYFYPLALTAQTCSVWTFALISVERFLAVCRPLDVMKFMTVSRVKISQTCIVLAAVVYNAVRFWEYERNPVPGAKGMDQALAYLRGDDTYFLYYFSILYQLTHFLIPFAVISSLNAFILRTIGKAFETRQRMSGTQQNQYRTCRMIIVVTVIFGACNSFTFALNWWELVDRNLYDGPNAQAAFVLLDVANIAILVNSSTNFIVYLIYCEKYRKLFVMFLTCRCRQANEKMLAGSSLAMVCKTTIEQRQKKQCQVVLNNNHKRDSVNTKLLRTGSNNDLKWGADGSSRNSVINKKRPKAAGGQNASNATDNNLSRFQKPSALNAECGCTTERHESNFLGKKLGGITN